MKFILFLVSYILNPIIVYSIPDVNVESFISYYMMSNIVYSLLFTVVFSTKLVAYYRPVILINMIILFIFSLINYNFVWAALPFSVLFGDYLCTQVSKDKLSKAYRFILIFSAVPFLFNSEFFFEFVILRICLVSLFGLYILFNSDRIERLKISSTTLWIVTTYVFYSGNLAIIQYVIDGGSEFIKVWFIVSQIGLGLILKVLDFGIRKSTGNFIVLSNAITGVSFIIPLIAYFKFPEPKVLLIYYISFFALVLLGKHNKKKLYE